MLSSILMIVALVSVALGVATLLMTPNGLVAKRFLMFAVVLQGLALLLPAVNTWPASTTLHAGNT